MHIEIISILLFFSPWQNQDSKMDRTEIVSVSISKPFWRFVGSCSCRIIGAALIALGLYLVLWGKTREERVINQDKEETHREHLPEAESKDKDCCVASDHIP